MHNSTWEVLLRHIPPEQQNQFSMVTASGMEIAIQSFLRIERELVVVKGRLSGSQEQNRVFFVPFANIDYIGTLNPVKDTEYNEVFGSLEFPDNTEVRVADPVVPVPETRDPVPATNGNGHGSNPGVQRGTPPQPARPTIRSEVLERFRNNNRPGGQ